eukprot:TRINITY_DN13852_c0_g1_i1.p1 TRINITY_DN13852_c0_g1~~TRINITY_DN13852_c0_g1_i1.p1  ORF type:complete len:355 (-),score=66.98 TRINITY_DN13852_c0_g1_i1:78-1142(-)
MLAASGRHLTEDLPVPERLWLAIERGEDVSDIFDRQSIQSLEFLCTKIEKRSATSKDNSMKISNSGLLPIIANELLTSNEKQIALYGLKLVWYLSRYPEVRKSLAKMVELNTNIMSLLKMAKPATDDNLITACSTAIGNLGLDQAFAKEMVSSNAIPVLISNLRLAGSVAVQESVIFAISNLSAHHETLPMLVKHEAISLILHLIGPPAQRPVRECACICLSNLLSLNNKSLTCSIQKSGVVRQLLDLLKIGIVKPTVSAFFFLTSTNAESKNEFRLYKGIPILLSLMQDERLVKESAILDQLTGTLMNLVTNNFEILEDMKMHGTLSILNRTLQATNNNDIKANIMYILNVLK